MKTGPNSFKDSLSQHFNIQMYNLPICKQNSLNGFDYISLAESKKQSLEHVHEEIKFLSSLQYTGSV